MDYFQRFSRQVRSRLFILVLVNNLVIFGDWWLFEHVLRAEDWQVLAALGAGTLLTLTVLPWFSTSYITQPTRLIWQAILHIAPEGAETPPPDLKHLRLGRELVTALVGNIYQLASVVGSIEEISKKSRNDLRKEFVANALPLPVIVLSKDATVVYGNRALLTYINRDESTTIGQNVYSLLDLSFTSERTLDTWLEKARADKVTAHRTWERVRLHLPNTPESEDRLLDLVAYYNKGNTEGHEIMLVLFDRTREYSQDEQALSFVALAVHELRTPLTLLRGYIEAFEEELQGKLDPELTGFMHKMKAAAQQLATFTSNILNVARFENDQLVLTLHEEQWPPLLQSAIDGMRLRAQVEGIRLTAKIADNLPTVGADAVSIYEVVSNLIDNAIKYSADSKEIIISSYLTKDGVVETTVQDFGVGVPAGAITSLFEKFYRNHRNRGTIGGTGLGLYLSKAIVEAHGGQVWVRSKEGQGATFGFTLQPYTHVADELKKGDNADIKRTVHGWIKNHSLYRR